MQRLTLEEKAELTEKYKQLKLISEAPEPDDLVFYPFRDLPESAVESQMFIIAAKLNLISETQRLFRQNRFSHATKIHAFIIAHFYEHNEIKSFLIQNKVNIIDCVYDVSN